MEGQNKNNNNPEKTGNCVPDKNNENDATVTTRRSRTAKRPPSFSSLNPGAASFMPRFASTTQTLTTPTPNAANIGEANTPYHGNTKIEEHIKFDDDEIPQQGQVRMPASCEHQPPAKCQYWPTGICLNDETECSPDHPQSPSTAKSTPVHRTTRSESTLNPGRSANQELVQTGVAADRTPHGTLTNAKKEMCHHWVKSMCKFREDECNGQHDWTHPVAFPRTSKFFGTPVANAFQQDVAGMSGLLMDTGSHSATNLAQQDMAWSRLHLMNSQYQPATSSAQNLEPRPYRHVSPRRFTGGPEDRKKEFCVAWARGACTLSDAQCPYIHQWTL